MSSAQHAPSDDPTFRASLVRHAAAAGALVVLVTGAFWAIGSFGDDDPTTVASPSPDAEDPPTDTSDEDDAPELGDLDVAEVPESPVVDPDPVEEEPAGSEADEGEPEGETDEAPADSEPDDDEQGDAEEAEQAEEPEDADEPDDATEPEQAPAIDPATITVQVLDGYQADGGTAAAAVASQLDDAGYDIVARNPALRYERTTVLWTAGFEAEARQVAGAIGAAEVREQPGNLSSQVAVHVVVGSDRG